jgi:hypothetical protein
MHIACKMIFGTILENPQIILKVMAHIYNITILKAREKVV